MSGEVSSQCNYYFDPICANLRTLNVSMRLKRSLDKLYEAGCNLTRRMCIIIYCDKKKKVKVKDKTFSTVKVSLIRIILSG